MSLEALGVLLALLVFGLVPGKAVCNLTVRLPAVADNQRDGFDLNHVMTTKSPLVFGTGHTKGGKESPNGSLSDASKPQSRSRRFLRHGSSSFDFIHVLPPVLDSPWSHWLRPLERGQTSAQKEPNMTQGVICVCILETDDV